MYSITGLLFVGLSSIGNRQSSRAIENSIVGCLFAFGIVATGFIDDITVVREEAAVATQYLLVVGTICGWIVVLCHLNQIVGSLLKNISFAQRIPFLQYLFV
jgi:UDP-N-acetylmuramyl pentapeptide phosphotransferase/UDP-N-acetylglucosamine-1-phosphate transferase